MNRSRRKRINKAKKEGVRVEEIDSDLLIPAVYNLMRGTYINAKLPLLDIALFKSAFAILYPKNMNSLVIFLQQTHSFIACNNIEGT